MSSPHPPNRLAREVSPYLQQHAHNPVDWYPWGPEALTRAENEDKPVLLSVGYSACHWCHVMERESFDDAATAAFMNEHFVNIKVDREERPDLDQIYQPVVQLLSGRAGGWPLTVFLTPRREPFFAGTYFPPVDRHGMPSFATVLDAVRDAYATRRDEVVRSAADLTEALRRVTSPSGDAVDVPADIVERAATALVSRYDETHGGFGTRPKFPNTMALDVLLRAHREGERDAMLDRVMRALSAMRDGGIYDQLGGGFHRYSTDAEWLVPHFEKMLYDNALILRLAADAYRVTPDAGLRETAEATVAYLVREMRDPAGGFYSSQDADSEGEEGRYFVWTPDEIDAVVTDRMAAAAVKLRFGVTPEGNFEGSGATVLHVHTPWPDVAAALGIEDDEARALVDGAVPMLLTARERRVKPFRDEKVIAAWNGLVIGALAEASMAFDEPVWREHALAALAFVRTRMWTGGRLRRIAKGDVVGGEAFLEDYGAIASAALDCYEASFDAGCLELAREVAGAALVLFQDEAGGGFFFAPDRDDLVVRAKDAFDNAVPSGTSSFCLALLRLHALTGEARWQDAAEGTLRGLTHAALTQPFGFGHLLGAMDRYVQGSTQIVLVATKDDPAAEALARVARRAYLPNRALLRVEPEMAGAVRAPEGVPAGAVERATVYVCRGRTCSLPVTEPTALDELLSS